MTSFALVCTDRGQHPETLLGMLRTDGTVIVRRAVNRDARREYTAYMVASPPDREPAVDNGIVHCPRCHRRITRPRAWWRQLATGLTANEVPRVDIANLPG